MRIKLNFSKNTSVVPFQYYSLVNSYIHNCLGRNNVYHDSKSDYCICLNGGTLSDDKDGFNFENGYILVTSLDHDFIGKLIIGAVSNPILFNGMVFSHVSYINDEFYNGWNYFKTVSPFLIKKYSDKKNYTFLTLNDENFEKEVESYLKRIVNTVKPNLDTSNFKVEIDTSVSHKVKNILVKNVINHANDCQINIFTNKKVAEFLYNIGIGQSTGSGFGTIRKTCNAEMY